MVRLIYLPRPVGIAGINPALVRPPVPGVRGPVITPVIRPVGIPSVKPTEKPQTTIYVGRIASTVDNDFILSVLQVTSENNELQVGNFAMQDQIVKLQELKERIQR